MKKSLVVLLLGLFTIAFTANAQMPSPEEMAKKQTEAMKKDLGLSGDQEKQVYTLFLENTKTMQELMASGADRTTMQEEFKKMQEVTVKKLKSILTEEQFSKFEKMMEEAAKRRAAGAHGGGF